MEIENLILGKTKMQGRGEFGMLPLIVRGQRRGML